MNAAAALPIPIPIPLSKLCRAFATSTSSKIHAFSVPVPQNRAYHFDTEAALYEHYSSCWFVLTHGRWGWDTMRHNEIVAAGSIPFFDNLEACPDTELRVFPKQLVLLANRLPGIHRDTLSIDWAVFPVQEYERLRDAIHLFFVAHRSCEAVAGSLLRTIRAPSACKVLFLGSDPSPDYVRCGLVTGLKAVLGVENAVDSVRVPHIYTSYDAAAASTLYGRGMSYTRVVHDGAGEGPSAGERCDRTNLTARLAAGEFYGVVYGSIHRGMPLLREVLESVPAHRIVLVCGEDDDEHGHSAAECGKLRDRVPGAVVFRR